MLVGPAVSVNNTVHAVGFEPKSGLVFAASAQYTIPTRLPDTSNSLTPNWDRLKRSFEVEHGYPLVGAAVSRDSKRLAGAVYTGSGSWVVVWDIAAGKNLGIAIDGADPVSFSPDWGGSC